MNSMNASNDDEIYTARMLLLFIKTTVKTPVKHNDKLNPYKTKFELGWGDFLIIIIIIHYYTLKCYNGNFLFASRRKIII